MMINSVKFKICVLYVGILGLILVAYRGLLYFNFYRALNKDSDEQLIIKATHVRDAIRSHLAALGDDKKALNFAARSVVRGEGEYPGQEKAADAQAQWLKDKASLELDDDYINFLSFDGKTIVSSSNIDRDLRLLFEKYVNIKQEKVTFGNVNYQGGVTLRLVVMPVAFNNFGRYIIEVGTFAIPVVQVLRKRIVSTALSILAILVIAIIISYLLVWRILGPVQQVARTAKTISYENLSHRVKVEHLDEEMKYLAESFNDMIARLEESFKYVSEFSSSVAHDLRTPLTIIKGETEVALQSGQNLEDCRRVMQSNLDEVERMLKTIDNMLMLTEIKYRKEAFTFERMDLAPFLNDIYEKTVILASQKNITVTFTGPKEPLITMVNQLYLRRLFFNLIHNAIKFTLQGGAINFSVRRAHKRVFVAITDTGIGITDEDRAKIFNKFFRAQSADRNDEPGSGLGLSIAQSIASMHQGCIEVRSAVGKGSTFTVILPVL